MSIHRARIKTVEEIDPKFLCCEATRQRIIQQAGMLWLVDTDIIDRKEAYCVYCLKEFGSLSGVAVVSGKFDIVMVDFINIEETPYTGGPIDAPDVTVEESNAT